MRMCQEWANASGWRKSGLLDQADCPAVLSACEASQHQVVLDGKCR